MFQLPPIRTGPHHVTLAAVDQNVNMTRDCELNVPLSFNVDSCRLWVSRMKVVSVMFVLTVMKRSLSGPNLW